MEEKDQHSKLHDEKMPDGKPQGEKNPDEKTRPGRLQEGKTQGEKMPVEKKRTMAGLEYSCLLRELSPLCGRFAGKFYELSEGLFRLKLGDADLICKLGERMHLTRYITVAPQAPTNFCEYVRKRIGGKKLVSISQHGMDRLITMKFSSQSETVSLIFEMFGSGNLLVLDSAGTIMRPYVREEWKTRRLARGEKYSPPPSQQIPFPPSEEDLKSLFSQPSGEAREKYAISALSSLSIGTAYVNEALTRAGIAPKTPLSSITQAQLSALSDSFSQINSSLLPMVYSKGGKTVDFSVCELSQYSSLSALPCQSLSQAADEFFQERPAATPASKEHDKKKQQLQDRLAKQQELLSSSLLQAEELSRAGKAILANSEMLSSLSGEIAAMRSQRLSWDEIGEMLKKRKIEMEKSASIIYLEL